MLTNRQSFFDRFTGIEEGMTVYCQDGDKLGKVSYLGEDSFTVEKGFFFPKDFTLRYDDVTDVRDGSIYTNNCQADLADWKDESYRGWGQVDDINAGRLNATPSDSIRNRFSDQTTTIPVIEEELEAKKTVHEAGAISVKKVVHSELKHLTIPVMKEEVRIERVPVDGNRNTDSAKLADAFNETEIRVPLMEEEIEVTKRPVVKEEVRISKERHTEERDVSQEVRKEEALINDQAARRRSKTPPSPDLHP